LVVLVSASVLVGGGAVGAGAPVQAGECPPAIGCEVISEYLDICIDTRDPLQPPTCPPMTESEREAYYLLCVGGDNQRKPGGNIGVCITGPLPTVTADTGSGL
jgi:hypothetical protein